MPIKLSKTLLNKLPEAERATAEKALWNKSGGKCYLCLAPLNRAADQIEADHDTPEAEGGSTTLANLNLAHISCNRAKRNSKSIDVRPYLRLTAFARKRRLKYDGFLEHFGIEVKPVVLSRHGDLVTFELPDGTSTSANVLSESNEQGKFEYCFVELPRGAIFNDDACQPRALRLEHAWAIYTDLQRNVLHEPPSCRVESETLDSPVRLLLFDGQHKTVASWMRGRDRITAKVYLNLTTPQANELVNSIQAKIKKLPLSPFELAGKMSDEWENKFHEYEEAVGSETVSEKGFLDWLPAAERTRGRQALQSALVQSVLAAEDLRIKSHVKRAGAPEAAVQVTEQQLKSKLIEKLLGRDPLSEEGKSGQATRDTELDNVVYCLNLFNDLAFEPGEGSEFTDVDKERIRRMTYQASLGQIASLMKDTWLHYVMRPQAKVLSDERSADLEERMQLAVTRLVAHPAWTAKFNSSAAMQTFKAALDKNQNVEEAFEGVALDLPYLVVGSDQSGTYKKVWSKGE